MLSASWKAALAAEFEAPYFRALVEFLRKERATGTVYPPPDQLFTAFRETPFDAVSVVILGQDPYHGPGQAHGLSFSVPPGVPVPPSLKNIYEELEQDVGCRKVQHGCLLPWAAQGVFLLNSALTVRAGQAGSHSEQWAPFTNRVIEVLNARVEPVVFILWGRHAQEKIRLIDHSRNPVIQAPHPSPFSAASGFFGSKPFSRANLWLRVWQRPEIDWQLPAFLPNQT